MRKGFFLFILLCIAVQSFSQTQIKPAFASKRVEQPRTLLWRITGNGLKSTSYLFGTIHLADKRVFNFDDSVYYSLERCEGMAMEVNPDEMIGYYINKSLDEKTTRVKDVLPEKEFNRYAKKLSARLKKPADKITTADIVREKNSWSQDIFSKGEMQTFVDAYLYGLARKQGKWVGGIEDISDQTGLIENFDQTDLEYLTTTSNGSEEAARSLNRMIRLYMDQDLESIYDMVGGSSDYKDRLLTRRNVKMARRMDSLSAIRSMFFAVGAAHLPGDSGVISLLRSRGFHVEPVVSNKKIAADNYKPKEVEIAWVKVEDRQGLYDVLMPGNPASIKIYGLVEMKFHVDISTITGYYSLVSPMLNKMTSLDELAASFAKGMFSTEKAPPMKKINQSGIEGREFTNSKDGLTYRVRMFLKDGQAYSSAMFATKSTNLQSQAAARFFDSFHISERKDQSTALTYHVDSVMGLRMLTPAPFEYTSQFSDNTSEFWKVTAYTSSDAQRSLYLMLFSKEIKPGYHIISDSVVHADLIARMSDSYGSLRHQEKITPAGKIVEFEGKNKESEVYMKGISIVRNNRNILLMLLGDSAMLAGDDARTIANSMEFFDQPAKWSWQTQPQKGLKAWVPGELRTFTDNNESSYVYAYDTATATSFIIIPDTLNRYTRYASDSAYWSEIVSSASAGEMLLDKRSLKIGELDGVELLLKDSSSFENYTRLRMILSDSILFKQVVYAGRKYLFSDEVNNFFTQFSYPINKNTDFITRSKTKATLAALRGSDINERLMAYNSYGRSFFDQSDLPELHAHLFERFLSPFDSTTSTVINNRIAGRVAELKSPSTVEFIVKSFGSLTGERADLQETALYTLAAMKTEEAYSVLKDLIPRYNSSVIPSMISDEGDSLQLTVKLLPVLLDKLSDTTFMPVAAMMITNLLDSGMIDIKEVGSYELKFLQAAEVVRRRILRNTGDFIWEHYQVIDLLNRLNTPASLKQLAGYMEPDIKYFRMKALIYLLEKKYPVLPGDIDKVAADPEIASSLYASLKASGVENFFPKKYLNQQHLAHSDIYSQIESDEVESISLVKTVSAKYKKTKYLFYLYAIKYNGSDEAYLGVSGGYEKNALEPAVPLSIVLEDPMQDNVAKQLEDYLRSLEE